VFVAGLMLAVVAVGVVVGAVAQGGLTARTAYLTGIGLFIMSGGFLAAVPLYSRFAALESALTSHKLHDLNALTEAARIFPDDTGPQKIHRIY
jgi:hypothetical protein